MKKLIIFFFALLPFFSQAQNDFPLQAFQSITIGNNTLSFSNGKLLINGAEVSGSTVSLINALTAQTNVAVTPAAVLTALQNQQVLLKNRMDSLSVANATLAKQIASDTIKNAPFYIHLGVGLKSYVTAEGKPGVLLDTAYVRSLFALSGSGTGTDNSNNFNIGVNSGINKVGQSYVGTAGYDNFGYADKKRQSGTDCYILTQIGDFTKGAILFGFTKSTNTVLKPYDDPDFTGALIYPDGGLHIRVLNATYIDGQSVSQGDFIKIAIENDRIKMLKSTDGLNFTGLSDDPFTVEGHPALQLNSNSSITNPKIFNGTN